MSSPVKRVSSPRRMMASSVWAEMRTAEAMPNGNRPETTELSELSNPLRIKTFFLRLGAIHLIIYNIGAQPAIHTNDRSSVDILVGAIHTRRARRSPAIAQPR